MLKSHNKMLWALAVIAIAAGVTAFVVSRELLAPERPPEPPPIAVQSKIPPLRPDIKLNDRDNQPRSLSEWDGKPLVVNFWATWCAPCRREIPMLNQLAKDMAPTGGQVVGIAIDFREDVLDYLKATPINYTVLIGEQAGLDAARDFGIENVVLPFTAFIDSKGRIMTIHMGELHRPQADIILGAIAGVDAGDLQLPAAREQIKSGLAKIEADPRESPPDTP